MGGVDAANRRQAVRVDRAVVESLATVIGADKVRGFIGDYVAEADRHVEAIREAWRVEDLQGVYRRAHDLVSIAGNFGCMAVSHLADRLQQAARGGRPDEIPALIAELEAEVGASSEELKAVPIGGR